MAYMQVGKFFLKGSGQEICTSCAKYFHTETKKRCESVSTPARGHSSAPSCVICQANSSAEWVRFINTTKVKENPYSRSHGQGKRAQDAPGDYFLATPPSKPLKSAQASEEGFSCFWSDHLIRLSVTALEIHKLQLQTFNQIELNQAFMKYAEKRRGGVKSVLESIQDEVDNIGNSAHYEDESIIYKGALNRDAVAMLLGYPKCLVCLEYTKYDALFIQQPYQLCQTCNDFYYVKRDVQLMEIRTGDDQCLIASTPGRNSAQASASSREEIINEQNLSARISLVSELTGYELSPAGKRVASTHYPVLQYAYRHPWWTMVFCVFVVVLFVWSMVSLSHSHHSSTSPLEEACDNFNSEASKNFNLMNETQRAVSVHRLDEVMPKLAQAVESVFGGVYAAWLWPTLSKFCHIQEPSGLLQPYREQCPPFPELSSTSFGGVQRAIATVGDNFSGYCVQPPPPPSPQPPSPNPPPSPQPPPPSPPPSPQPPPPNPPPSPQPPPSPPPSPPVPPPSPPNPPSPPPSPPNPPSPPPSPPAVCDALGKPIANITQFTDGIKALQTIATTLLPSAPDTVVLKRILDWCVIDPNVGFKYLADYCAYLKSLNPTGTVGLILQMARYCLNRH